MAAPTSATASATPPVAAQIRSASAGSAGTPASPRSSSPRRGAGQHAERHHLGGHPVQHGGIAGGVQHPPARARDPERGRRGGRPHVIDHQQAPPVRQYLAQQRPAPRPAERSSGYAAPSRSSRPSCAATRSPCSPTVTQNTPSGKRRRTCSSRASAAASTVLPIPPWPCSPRAAPVTPTAPSPAASTASRRPASSSRATKARGGGGTSCRSPSRTPRRQRLGPAGAPAPGHCPSGAGAAPSAVSIPLRARQARTIWPSGSPRSLPGRRVPGRAPTAAPSSTGTACHRHGRTSTGTSRTRARSGPAAPGP